MRPLLATLLLVAAAALAQSAPDAATLFAYDAKAPLDYQEASTEELPGGVQVLDISYASPKGGRVPGYLVVPPAPKDPKQKFAGIVYMHWGQGNRSEFLSEAISVARRGAVSIMIDAPYWRPDVPAYQGFVQPDKERASYIQLVVDLRRAVDVLLARPDVDPARIGYVGHSLGATWGGPLVAVDKRFKCAVLMGGLPSLTDFDDTSFFSVLMHSLYTDTQRKYYAQFIAPINPQNFVGASSPTSLLFQFAEHDMYISRSEAEKYFAAAGKPKQIRWYFTSHEFNDERSRSDRLDFLTRELKLKPTLE